MKLLQKKKKKKKKKKMPRYKIAAKSIQYETVAKKKNNAQAQNVLNTIVKMCVQILEIGDIILPCWPF